MRTTKIDKKELFDKVLAESPVIVFKVFHLEFSNQQL